MEGIYLHTEIVEGIGEIKFLPIPAIELSPIYRKVGAMIVEAKLKMDSFSIEELYNIVNVIEDKRIDEVRNGLFKYMIVNDVNLLKSYDKIMNEKGFLIEIPLLAMAVKIYLGKHLKLALKSDSPLRKALVSLFPQVENILTGFSGDQLSEKLQDLMK